MIGAIIGDILGSVFERDGKKDFDFKLFEIGCSFTDDSVLTMATARNLIDQGSYAQNYRIFAAKYPNAGYGKSFKRWMTSFEEGPYESWGNGSAMRVSPVAYAFETIEEVLAEAERSAEVTHNHPEGIKGAQAIASAVFLARKGKTKEEIKNYIESQFGYYLGGSVEAIRPLYRFDVSCQGSVPQSIICFLESYDFESAVRNAISLGGDTDTMACMAGAIAEAFYGEIPIDIVNKAKPYLTKDLIQTILEFQEKYDTPVKI